MADCSETNSSDAKFNLHVGRVSWLSKNSRHYHGWTVAKRTVSRVDFTHFNTHAETQ